MKINHPASANGNKVVVIVGAGFAGLNAAKELSNTEGLHVILVDQRNHHLFQPLLYQVATAGLNPSDIAVPIRAQFSDSPNVEVHLAQVAYVDLEQKFVRSKEGVDLGYDYLILACGARHSYFGKSDWEEHAPGLKTIEQATEIRRRILLAFENAENELDETKKQANLTFVVVGAGPTGVEMAGAISDISQTVLSLDFKHINTKSAKVILLEAGPNVLGAFDESLSHKATHDLQSMGIDVRTNTRVTDITAQGVQTADGQFIPSHTVIWAAGVQATPLTIVQNVERDRAGRILVGEDFALLSHPDAFVVGDLAAYTLPDGKTLPGLAPVAMQSGRFASAMIKASLAGKPRKRFQYLDKGQMATIGKRKAIAQIGSLKLSGFIAWAGWLFVHVLYLVGFKNKVSVFVQWTWSYLFAKRGSRLITTRDWKLDSNK